MPLKLEILSTRAVNNWIKIFKYMTIESRFTIDLI